MRLTILPYAALLAAAPAAAAATEPAADAPAAAPDAAAADAGSDVVVTARRRAERAQDVPIALSVVGGETIDRTGYTNLVQIADLTPTLVIRNNNARNTFANIRGLGSNANQNDGLEIGVGFYIDDVYYGRIGASQFDLIDLDRLEVLRGPQGTLFGKNTTAGAINITTRAPTFDAEFTGEAHAGERGFRQLRASASAPIVGDRIAARLTASYTEQNGLLRNTFNDRRINDFRNATVRGQLLILPTEQLTIRLIADYSRQDAYSRLSSTVGVVTRYANGAVLPNTFLDRAARAGYVVPYDVSRPFDRRVDADAAIQADMEGYGGSAKADWDLGAAALTSITAYRWWDWYPLNDADNTRLDINTAGGTINRQRQFSQEIRLASTGTRTIDYVAGVYYFWQVIDGLGRYRLGRDYALWNNPTANQTIANYALTGFQSNSVIVPRTKSYAAFGQATWHVSSALSLTGGLRFTHEDKTGLFDQRTVAGNDLSLLTPAQRATAQALRDSLYPEVSYTTGLKDDALTGQATVSYVVAPDVLTYASYQRGSKSGGLSLGQLPAGVSPVVDPETVDAYEVGLKSQFWNRRITANLAAFWTDVQDYQAAITELIGQSANFRRYISNIPGVRSRGFEADLIVAPSRFVRLTASAAYTDAVYKGFTNAQISPDRRNEGQVQDLSGVQLANAPKFVYSLAADLTQPVAIATAEDEIYARVDYVHRSSYDTSDFNSPFTRIAPYGVVNARLGVKLGTHWDASLWARNLFDKRYFTALSLAANGLVTGNIGDPQQFGGTLRARF